MVRWAKIAVVAGLVLLLAGFGFGVQPTSATLGQETYACGSAIPMSWLLSGATVETSGRARPATQSERHRQAACREITALTRVEAWGLLGLGVVIFLCGWTVLRERGPSMRAGLAPAAS